MEGQSEISKLFDIVRPLGPGDFSVIEAISAEDGAGAATSPGSPNDRAFAHMERMGWVRGRMEIAPPGQPGIEIKIYEVQEEFRDKLKYFVDYVRRDRVVTDIYNSTCGEFIATIMEGVRKGGGPPEDVNLLLGLTVAWWIHKTVQPAHKDEIIESIVRTIRMRVESLAETPPHS